MQKISDVSPRDEPQVETRTCLSEGSTEYKARLQARRRLLNLSLWFPAMNAIPPCLQADIGAFIGIEVTIFVVHQDLLERGQYRKSTMLHEKSSVLACLNQAWASQRRIPKTSVRRRWGT